MSTCEYCKPIAFPKENKNLITFDTSTTLEGYVSVDLLKDRAMHLVVTNDYGIAATEINFCPMCGKSLKNLKVEGVNE